MAAVALAATALGVGRGAGQSFPTAVTSAAPERAYPIDPDEEPRPVLRAERVAGEITLNGVLDEPSWSRAEVAANFVQGRPMQGRPSTSRTEVRILYDSRNLYVGAVLEDERMDLLRTAGLEHDFQPFRGELFGVALDPFLDRRSSYLFMANPGGAMRDEQDFDNGRTIATVWDSPSEIATALTDSAWVVEMRIPINILSFNPERDREPWGLNLFRIGRGGEMSNWAPLPARDVAFVMSKAGYLTGLEGLEEGRGLRVKPFVLSSRRDGSLFLAQDRGTELDAGLDLKYGITPKLTLDLTYRTDFSQVEVDQQQLNLSRFSPFFQERREFFIENQGTFTFGDVSGRELRSGVSTRDFSLFHSRRIGLSEEGTPIPLLGGGRLTGRAGAVEFGLLNLQSERTTETPGENFSVARVKSRLLADSDIGVLFAQRLRTSGEVGQEYNRSYGVDANFHVFDHLYISSYLAATTSSESGSDGTAGRIQLGWRDGLVNTSAVVRRIDDGFDPGLGFLRRGGIQHYYGTVGIHPRVSVLGLSEVNPYLESHYITGIDGGLESRETAGVLTLTFQNSSTLNLEYRNRFERIESAFNIFQDVRVKEGDYQFAATTLSFRSSQSSVFTGNVTVTAGDFFSGTRKTIALSGAWRPRHDFFMNLEVERNDVDLETGSFLADIASLRAEYAWSTRLFGSARVQYNAQTDQLVTETRVVFRHAPLSEVFLVYQSRREIGLWGPLERLFAIKATRSFQF